ncbi:SDR family oxidoreductase [uncultured Roseobacter sp.]|uniref:SDR family oxidoreductase n=1 Tax=uncultured Roseobacter sp. TaxID=114847 RepID=UPI002625CFFA|nr:SDR family oxidoreductase [uncultured Roseobacter sp.]
MKRACILIIGGTGVFGRRLARHLMAFGGIELFVTSRSSAKADRFAEVLRAGNEATPVQGVVLDCHENLTTRLDEIRPFAVIDCSGPFQHADFEIARSVVSAGAHLIDLADARSYLAGFTDMLGELARAKGVAALTGASSTPTLSACVVDHLTREWQRVDTIDICITPGGKSEVGRSVIEAILSYAGKDIPIWRNGQLSHTSGWSEPRLVDIPGLGPRRVAAVETYDAEYLGSRHEVQSRVSFSAGLESIIEQRGIETLATLRKRHLLPDLGILIPALLKARQVTRLPTSDRGGMQVSVCGLDAQGGFTQAHWTLVAKNDHGPNVPILPAAAALEKLLAGEVEAGARLAHNAVTLPDILAEASSYAIETNTEVMSRDHGLFEAHLGTERFRQLPRALQHFHGQTSPPVWSGEADIDAGHWFLPRFVAWVFGFPKAGRNIPVSVSVDRKMSRRRSPIEHWTRSFDGQKLTSRLARQKDGYLTETFWPFSFVLPVRASPDRIKMPVASWTLGKVPLPSLLAPRSETSEFQDHKGRFCFDVRLSLPMIGLLAHYRGWLRPMGDRAARKNGTETKRQTSGHG